MSSGGTQIAVGLLQLGELKFDQQGGAVSLCNRGAKGQPTCTDIQPRRPASGDGCRRAAACLQRLTTHSKNRVGMAGFEPAASCSQISSIRTLDVARCSPTWRQPAVMLARRSLKSIHVCAHWLPAWRPKVASAEENREARSVHRAEYRIQQSSRRRPPGAGHRAPPQFGHHLGRAS
jgi:hypothetical protein